MPKKCDEFDARLGRLVRLRKTALLSHVEENGLSCLDGCLDDDEEDDDYMLHGVISHTFMDDADGSFTGMIQLTFGRYESWEEAHEELKSTNYRDGSRTVGFLHVSSLEATGDLVYVDGKPHPPLVPVITPTGYREMKLRIELANRKEEEDEERMREVADRAKLAKRERAKGVRREVSAEIRRRGRRQEKNQKSRSEPKSSMFSTTATTRKKTLELSMDSSHFAAAVEALVAMGATEGSLGCSFIHEDQPWEVF